MAERVGFEPTEPVKAQQFSRLPDSTTLAPLRESLIVMVRAGKYQVTILDWSATILVASAVWDQACSCFALIAGGTPALQSLSPFPKELLHQRSTLIRQHAGYDLDTMIQVIAVTKPKTSFHAAEPFIVCTEHQPRDTRVH